MLPICSITALVDFRLLAKLELTKAKFVNSLSSVALLFHTYSTFLGKSGLYLEDLFVKPEMRSKGLGKTMLAYG